MFRRMEHDRISSSNISEKVPDFQIHPLLAICFRVCSSLPISSLNFLHSSRKAQKNGKHTNVSNSCAPWIPPGGKLRIFSHLMEGCLPRAHEEPAKVCVVQRRPKTSSATTTTKLASVGTDLCMRLGDAIRIVQVSSIQHIQNVLPRIFRAKTPTYGFFMIFLSEHIQTIPNYSDSAPQTGLHGFTPPDGRLGPKHDQRKGVDVHFLLRLPPVRYFWAAGVLDGFGVRCWFGVVDFFPEMADV